MPMHDALRLGTLRSLLDLAGVRLEDFAEHL